MKEYTILSVISIFATIALERLSGVNLFKRKLFYLFIFIILFFEMVVNGYLTKNNIFLYNNDFFMGFRIGSIPFEDFLFGLSMVTMTIIFWEYFKKEKV